MKNPRRMKRNPRKVRWTKAFRKAAGKEMTIVSYRYPGFGQSSHSNRPSGFDNRLREAQECPSQIRQRLDSDHSQGHEAGGRNQSKERTCILQTQVSWSEII